MVTTSNLDYDTRILSELKTMAPFYDITIITPGYYKPSKKLPFKIKVSAYKFSKKINKDFARVANLTAIIRTARRENADIYHAHDLPGLWCAILAIGSRKKVLIYDSHELWSDVNLFGVWRALCWPFRLLEKILASRVTAIITVNDSIKSILEKKYHKPTLSIYNYPLVKAAITLPAKLKTDKKIILYIGAFRKGRGLINVLQAAKQLDDSFQFIFIGYGRKEQEIRSTIKTLNLEKKVFVKPPLQPDELVQVIRKAHVGLCLIENTSLSYFYSSPNKLFQYIAAEIPILASDFPEQKKVVQENKIGEVVDPAEVSQIVQKIKLMTKRAQQVYYRRHLKGLAAQKYDWRSEEESLIKFYENQAFLRSRDFSLDKYARLCQELAKQYRFLTFAASLEKDKPAKFVILRHDVDRLPHNALAMAKLEANLGIKSSYYFRSSQLKSSLPIIKEIALLGHEVGYHYECLDQAKGNFKNALRIFEKYLTEFRQYYPVKTVAMHGNPITHFNNRHLWQHGDFHDFGIKGETYLSLARGTFYFSDTGRTWSNRFKVKDVPVRTNHEHRRFKVETTDDLINLVQNSGVKQLCITTHPERWTNNWLGWAAYFCLDKIVQLVKKVLQR